MFIGVGREAPDKPGTRATKFAIVASALLFSSVSWASTAACTAAATLASYGTGTANGCYSVDQTFSNFSVSSQSTGIATVQSTSTDDIHATDNFSIVSTPWTQSAIFTAAVAADWTDTAMTSRLGGTLNYDTDSQHALLADPNYQNPGTGDNIYIHTASLAATGNTGTGDAMLITEVLCIGTAACVAGDSVTITETWGASSGTPTLACGAVGATAHATCAAGVVTFTINATQLNITDTYLITPNGTSSTTSTLDSFTNIFTDQEEAPEPSTFVLLGTALAGIGFLRTRRKKA